MAPATTIGRWLRGAGGVVLVVAALEYGVVPALLEARSDLAVLRHVNVGLLLVALCLEAGALVAYTALTQVALQPSPTLPFGTQLRIDLVGNGLSRVLPGGGATSAAFRVRLMTERGVATSAGLALVVTQMVLSALGLLTVWLLGALMSVPRTGVTATTVLLLATAGGAVAALAVGRRREPGPERAPSARWPVGARLVRAWEDRVRPAVRRVVSSLRDAEITRSGLTWSTVNWLLDAVCLWVCLVAYGTWVPIELVLTAFGLVNAVAMLPLTPGGLGIVEGLLVPALIAAGAPAPDALLGVLTWRVLQYWLPLPVAGLCWLSLAAGTPRERRPRRGRPPRPAHPQGPSSPGAPVGGLLPDPAPRANHGGGGAVGPSRARRVSMDEQLRTGVVVGVDGSDGSDRAVHFGALEAQRRGSGLTLVHVVPDFVTGTSPRYRNPDQLQRDVETAGRAVLASAAEAAAAIAGAVPVTEVLPAGRAVPALLHAAEHASLLVLGRETVRPVRRLVSGAITLGAAARATVPVVSVPASWSPERTDRKVVAGYKAPAHSPELLATAFAEAAARDARLVLVHTWTLPGLYDDLIVTRTRREEWSKDARAGVEHELADHRARYPGVTVDVRVTHDLAAHALVEEAADADLLVLVRRAHGFPPAVHLGSTARAVLHAAACPVLVLPPQHPGHGAPGAAGAAADVPLPAGTSR